MSVWIAGGVFRIVGDYDYSAVRLLWVFLDLCNVLLIYALSGRLFDRRIGFWAACLYAVYPAAIGRAVYVTSEIPAILFSLLALICLARLWERGRARWALGAGLCLGLGTLSRGTLLPALVLYPATATLSKLGGERTAHRVKIGLIMFAAGCAVWTPWVVRNRIAGGMWVPVSTNAAFNLHLSAASDEVSAQDNLFLFHPWATSEQRTLRRHLFDGRDHAPSALAPEEKASPPVAAFTPTQEFERSRLDRQRAFSEIVRDPLFMLLTTVGRFARFWALDTHVKALFGRERAGNILDPNALTLIAASNLIYVFAFLLGVVGLTMNADRRMRILVAIHILGQVLVCSLVYSKPRYHLLVMPLMLPLATWAALNLRTWRAHLNRMRVCVIGACWLFGLWTWTAWVIFCFTSRMGAAAGSGMG